MLNHVASRNNFAISWLARLALVALLLNSGNPFLVALVLVLYASQMAFHRGAFAAPVRARQEITTLSQRHFLR
jgi:hypothetical protein